ncbi:hypothetical protein AB9F29_00270 [Falsihalocynthiibacter sp. S25ZX9]|uniref:hypothetical protein n=1 Tax=Falsihalocynthiibacter sp. S25ZX9 TaxID=3240870 RepID=UPI0035106DCD
MPFTVFVDDNFHHGDPEERLTDRTYETRDEAIARCKQLIENELLSYLEQGFSVEKLYATWMMFGEAPYIPEVDYSAKKSVETFIAGLSHFDHQKGSA